MNRRWLNWASGSLLSLAVSLVAFAALNSAEKKATHEAQSAANEVAARVKTACGNPQLGFSFDWFAFKDLDYTQGGFSRVDAMKKAGDRANHVGNAMVAICEDSLNSKASQYKEALSRISKVQLTPHSDARNFRIEFSKQDNTLLAQFGAFGESSTEDLTLEIRKLF